MAQRRYAQGQIIVWFRNEFPINLELAKYLGEQINMKFIETVDEQGYIYETEIGNEKKSCQKFKKKYSTFVEDTAKRDILYERRNAKLEAIVSAAEEIRDGDIMNRVAPTKKKFNEELKGLLKLIQDSLE